MNAFPTSDKTKIIGADDGAPAKLVVADGKLRGRTHLLPRRGVFAIGRAQTNDVVVEDDSEISRHHCRILSDESGYRIEDLCSFNGTFVDGEKIASVGLVSGSRIHVGRTHFVLVLPDETQMALPAATAFPATARIAAPDETSTRDLIALRPRRWTKRRVALAALALIAAAGLAFGGRAVLGLLGAGTRSVQVASTPLGAEVFLDNEFLGLTPIEVEFAPSGPHALRVAKYGYTTWRRAIGADTPDELTVSLEAAGVAELFVSAGQSDATVYLDGRVVGKTKSDRPLRIPGVTLGQHELWVEKPNFARYERRIEIMRPGSVRVHARLVSRQVATLLELVDKEPRSAQRLTELGHAYMVNKQFDKAIEIYRKALVLVYSRRDTSRYHGRLRNEMATLMAGGRGVFDYGTPEETETVRGKVEDVFISLAPEHREARLWVSKMARQYAKQRQTGKAVRLYGKLMAVRPDDPTVHYVLASYQMQDGELDAALVTLERATTRFPDKWTLQCRLGQAYARRAAIDKSAADKQKALVRLQQALRLCPKPEQQANIQHYIERTEQIEIP